MSQNMTMEEAAKAIGGATTRAYHLTIDKTNRVLVETRKFENIAMAAADGFEKKYSDLLELAEKFTYTVKVLTENAFPSALNGLEKGIQWLREHKEENVDKTFMGCYFWGYSVDEYKSEIKIAMKEAGITQKQLSEMLNIPLDTIKNWCCGRRRPDSFKEKTLIEKIRGYGKPVAADSNDRAPRKGSEVNMRAARNQAD